MKEYDIVEAPISLGSPSRGSECAYEALIPSLRRILKCNEIPFSGEKQQDSDCPDFVKYAAEVMRINKALYKTLKDCRRPTLLIGGDHSVVMASIAADAEKFGAENVAVVYVDGHADINTESTSPTGYIHGMPLAVSMGITDLTINDNINLYGKNLFIIGARSIDDGEYAIMKNHGVSLFTADEVKSKGVDAVMREIIPKLKDKNVHLSFDVDVIDGKSFSSTGYVMPNGLGVSDTKQILAAVINNGIASFDCVEYNPSLDNGKDKKTLLDILSLLA